MEKHSRSFSKEPQPWGPRSRALSKPLPVLMEADCVGFGQLLGCSCEALMQDSWEAEGLLRR